MKYLEIVFMFLAFAAGVRAFNYQLTWEAEGNDDPRSRFFSRKLHVFSNSAGLTLGRGYDMKMKSPATVKNDLTRAGVKDADKLSKGAGRYWASAKRFIIKNKLQHFQISHSSQQILFEITVSRKISTAKRIFAKADVVKKYGRADWDTRKQLIKDLVIDLLFRAHYTPYGDYTSRTRSFLQKPIVQNDVKRLAVLMSDRALWPGVPYDRFKRRMDYMNHSILPSKLERCGVRDKWLNESKEVNYQLTWEAEGNDDPRSRFFSRKLHVFSNSAGLTLGRGYDMKMKSPATVKNDLTRAGVKDADKLSKGAGRYWASAKRFIIKNKLQHFQISHSSQQILFEITLSRKISTAKRIFAKADVVKKYGRADWDKRKQPIKDLVIDLLFRAHYTPYGDYTPRTRSFLQKPIVQNDVKRLAVLMSDRALWPGVPYDRFKRRMDYMKRF